MISFPFYEMRSDVLWHKHYTRHWEWNAKTTKMWPKPSLINGRESFKNNYQHEHSLESRESENICPERGTGSWPLGICRIYPFEGFGVLERGTAWLNVQCRVKAEYIWETEGIPMELGPWGDMCKMKLDGKAGNGLRTLTYYVTSSQRQWWLWFGI